MDFLWSAVSLIPAINLSTVLLTPLKNDHRWQRLKGLKFIAGVNDTAEKLFTGVNDRRLDSPDYISLSTPENEKYAKISSLHVMYTQLGSSQKI